MMKRFGLATGILLLAPLATAIVWRNDISEQTVLNFGATSEFLGVGMVDNGYGYGTGTYIGFGNGYSWGLTAKHVITTGQTGTFRFEDGRNFNIVQAFGLAGTDIAIFKLASFDSGIFQPGLNSGSFTIAQPLDSAGYGGHGPEGGGSGGWSYDNKRRGMQTRLAGYGNTTINGDTFLSLEDVFLPPSNPNCRPIQGFGAPGDSGSALLDAGGTILGVLSWGYFEAYGNSNYYAALTPTISSQIYQQTGITPVPEPATLVALGLGVLAALRRQHRSR